MKIRIRSAIPLFTLALAQTVLAIPAVAGPASEAALRAEDLLAKGETLPAYNAFDTAQHAFWQASPLTFRKAVLVEEAGSFGDYDLRANAEFRPGDMLTIYAEPVGFGIGTRDGQYQISLDTDLVIETASGTRLVRRENLFAVRHSSRSRNRDFNMNLSLVVPPLKPGDYFGVFTVKDRISRKTSDIRVPFSIRADGAD